MGATYPLPKVSKPDHDGQLSTLPLKPLPSQPLISILVGTYNYDRYLPIAIESVLKQTYRNWEMLIVDDGSTDQSWRVLEHYSHADRRISIAVQKNAGHGAALNTAFNMAQGDLIALLDADDAFEPNKLERVVTQFHGDSSAGILIHRLQRITGEGRPYGHPMPDSLISGYIGPQALRQGGNVSGVPPTTGLVFRREVAQEVFPIPAIFRRAADAYLFRLAQFITPITSVPDALSLYRIHGANVTASGINAPTMLKLVEDYHHVYAAQRSFLKSTFGADVSRRLDLKIAPGYCEFVLSAGILTGQMPPETPFLNLCDAVDHMQRLGRRLIWGLLCRLPRSLSAPLLNFLLRVWWSESGLGAALRRASRRVGI